MGSKSEDDPPLDEPVIIPDTHFDGTLVDGMDGTIRITGFSRLHSGGEERRIVGRVVMTSVTARDLIMRLRKVLTAADH